MRKATIWIGVVLVATGVGCGTDTSESTTERFEPEATGEWLKFEPEGAVCANGSQYKYFVNFSDTSDNLVIFFEAGSLCWNYEDCANARAFNTECIREAPGTECIRDDYMDIYLHLDELEPLTALTEPIGVVNGDVPVELAYPMLSSNPDINPMAEWNKVFIPYCTGDTHLGSRVRTYTDPDGVGPDVEFHHVGHQNTLVIIDDLNSKFRSVSKMMVSGCSAGGLGSLNNYPFVRNGMTGVDKAYLIADSGPVMPSTLLNGQPSHSSGIYDRAGPTWGIDTMLESFPSGGDRILEDPGTVNAVVAEAFPDDRLSISIFERDYNFTLSSYESFFPIFANEATSVDTGPGRTEIYRLASEDLESLRASFDELDNLAYYMPYFRNTNDSHCLTVTGLDDVDDSPIAFLSLFETDPSAATWAGTEIADGATTVTFKSFIEHVLDDSEPLQSWYEGTCEGEFQVCALDCAAYDEALCDEAVQ